MNDRFKFRVWNNVENYYEEEGVLLDSRTGKVVGYYDDDCFTIEQCTGLKDKNGKLIYEGDILRVEDADGVCDKDMQCDTGVGAVEWICKMWYIADDINNSLHNINWRRSIEIIGNIHDKEQNE